MFFSPSYKKVGTAIKIKYRYCSDNDIENDTDTDTDNDIENDSTKMLQKYFFYSSETFQQVGGCNQNQIRETPVSSAVLCQPRALSILLTIEQCALLQSLLHFLCCPLSTNSS